jgi:hypothetical protein
VSDKPASESEIEKAAEDEVLKADRDEITLEDIDMMVDDMLASSGTSDELRKRMKDPANRAEVVEMIIKLQETKGRKVVRGIK